MGVRNSRARARDETLCYVLPRSCYVLPQFRLVQARCPLVMTKTRCCVLPGWYDDDDDDDGDDDDDDDDDVRTKCVTCPHEVCDMSSSITRHVIQLIMFGLPFLFLCLS